MNTRGVNALSGVIHAAMQTHQTAAGIAMAVEAAGMCQSPEAAAELVRLREERHSTNESLDEAIRALRASDELIAGLRQKLVTARAELANRHDDLAGALGRSEEWADLISVAAANTSEIARGGAR